jgi:ADP-dependent NAD(P)H-hydrate dehydratase / NAD(P)H-hydrate epimerase
MQILNAAQTRAWDEYTMQHEPVASLDLMERAAGTCYQWLMRNGFQGKRFVIFCGKGNNGGDGLALARLLNQSKHSVTVYILEFGHLGTEDFQANLAALHETNTDVKFISAAETIPTIDPNEIIIDALFGSGLSRPLEGLTALLVKRLNHSRNTIISIDIPSGLYVDRPTGSNTVIKAKHTLSFQSQKLAFLVGENAPYFGEVHILDIGLHPQFIEQSISTSSFTWVDKDFASSLYRPRKKFSHKGHYGHAAIISGSKGMMGATILCTRGCIRAGAGKVTAHIPSCGHTILQTSIPEAMCKIETGDDYLKEISSFEKYNTIGIGPGIGLHEHFDKQLESLFDQFRKPIVIDADALTILSQNSALFKRIPPLSILTPHPKEWERLFGNTTNEFEAIERTILKSKEFNIIIVLKGHNTLVATPAGRTYINSSGNPGLAKGGSGDVLTGIITGLLAQGYEPEHAAILGVFLHGYSADLATKHVAEEFLNPSDIIDNLGYAFLDLYPKKS